MEPTTLVRPCGVTSKWILADVWPTVARISSKAKLALMASSVPVRVWTVAKSKPFWLMSPPVAVAVTVSNALGLK